MEYLSFDVRQVCVFITGLRSMTQVRADFQFDRILAVLVLYLLYMSLLLYFLRDFPWLCIFHIHGTDLHGMVQVHADFGLSVYLLYLYCIYTLIILNFDRFATILAVSCENDYCCRDLSEMYLVTYLVTSIMYVLSLVVMCHCVAYICLHLGSCSEMCCEIIKNQHG